MRVTLRQRRTLYYLLSAALILSQMTVQLASPRPAQAALSADPNTEIVYIDDNDVIRVLDTSGEPKAQWFSPDAGWDEIALLDVNDDGDLEILAMDKQGESTVRWTVFDPVLARGSTDPNKQINGIPWDILYTETFGGNGQYVVGGNFDQNVPGDEVAIGFRNGDDSIVKIYNARSLDSNQKPTGRDWKVHIEKQYPKIEYTSGIAGQLNGQGADELILFDPESDVTRMDIYRPDQDMVLLDNETSSNDRFKQGVAGQIIEDGQEELTAILTVDRPTKTSLRTYIMGNDGEVEEDATWAFAPQPDWLFLADIRNNGDEEVFFLRNYPEGENGARLIMRDDWGDDQRQNTGLIEWSLMEDGSNNEFRSGAGGDVDGDGREEVILLRDDRIRIYNNPENGRESDSNFTDYMLPTNNKRNALLVGDLDSLGFTTGPILLVSGNMIDAVVPAGTISQDFTVSVSNVGTDGGVGINVIKGPNSAWAEINPTFVTTPASIRVRFNATSLAAGVYNTTMTLQANRSNVQNDNYVIYLNLTVVPPVLEPNPPILSMYRLPCEPSPCSAEQIAARNQPFTSTVEINGSNDLTFRAAIIGVSEPADVSAEATVASTADGLAGPITGGSIDANGNIVIYDDLGNSRTLGGDQVTSAAALTTTLLVDPNLTWIMSATLSSETVPADLKLIVDPRVLTEDYQREYAVLVLVADTRAGTPNGNVKLVPIELANIGDLLWAGLLRKE